MIFWKWEDIDVEGRPYLRRLRVVEIDRLFSIKLHVFSAPDADRYLHDHPWWFVSLVLRGSYLEETSRGKRLVRWLSAKRARDAHRIDEVEPGTMTLVLTGPRKREWGFFTGSGWLSHEDYLGE